MRNTFCYWGLLIVLLQQSLIASDKLPELHHRSDLLMPESLLLAETLLYEKDEKDRKKVVCKTCHGIADIQEKDFKQIDKKQDNFLRNGPYQPLSDFCYLCHKRKQNQRENIHILLDKKGQKKEQQCLYCHTDVLEERVLKARVLKESALKRDALKAEEFKNDDAYKLRLPKEKICYGCHLRTPHLNALEHQGEVSEEMLAYMEKMEQKNGVHLPLSAKTRITCVTCHDPHQQGVLKKGEDVQKKEALKQQQSRHHIGSDLELGVSYENHPWAEVYNRDKKERLRRFNNKNSQIKVLQYQRINHEVLLRLPAKNGVLCLACHDFSRERLW